MVAQLYLCNHVIVPGTKKEDMLKIASLRYNRNNFCYTQMREATNTKLLHQVLPSSPSSPENNVSSQRYSWSRHCWSGHLYCRQAENTELITAQSDMVDYAGGTSPSCRIQDGLIVRASLLDMTLVLTRKVSSLRHIHWMVWLRS